MSGNSTKTMITQTTVFILDIEAVIQNLNTDDIINHIKSNDLFLDDHRKLTVLHCDSDHGKMSITEFAVGLARSLNLLPSPRTVLLTLANQMNAIQLCLARINKKRSGYFSVIASDIMDVWNHLFKQTFTDKHRESMQDHHLDLELSSADPVTREFHEGVRDYQEFLKNSSTIDHFTLALILQREMKNKESSFYKALQNQTFIISGIDSIHSVEQKLLMILLQKTTSTYRITTTPSSETTCNFDIHETGVNIEDFISTKSSFLSKTLTPQSVVMSPKGISASSRTVSPLAKSIKKHQSPKFSSTSPKTPRIGCTSPKSPISRSKTKLYEYMEQLIIGHLQLLINTRDELSLALVLAMPGREVSQEGFSDIKDAAHNLNMPMYQTIMSFVMKRRLGGKGYQPDPDCPLLKHEKPLSEFVDFMFKLQNIIEEEVDNKKASMKVLTTIRSGICSMKGCVLRRNVVDRTINSLKTRLQQILDSEAYKTINNFEVPSKTSISKSLKNLQQLCDNMSSRGWEYNIANSISEDVFSQGTPMSSQDRQTPLKVPSILNLFKSPADNFCADEDSEDLLTRVLKQKGQVPASYKTSIDSNRNKSHCSWAPSNLSPVSSKVINVLDSPESPIYGPTLKAVGRASKHRQNWREIVHSFNKDVEENKPIEMPKPEKKSSSVKRTKRSLLSDISNIDTNEDKTKKLKQNDGKKKSKLKPLPSGQKPITSFFKK